jgi:hypothetical protein
MQTTTDITNNYPSSWLEWFNTRESSITIDKEKQEQLLSKFDFSKSTEECKQSLLLHDETVFLFKENFGDSKVNTFHHLSEVGGTVYDQLVHFGSIQGVDKDVAAVVTPDTEVLLSVESNEAVQVPTMTSLWSVSSVEDVDNLIVGATTSYHPRNFIPIVPFLLTEVNDSILKGGSAKELLVAMIKSMKNFDLLHQGDDDYKDKSKTKCKNLIHWCYLVAINSDSIKSTPAAPCGIPAVIKALKSKAERAFISRNNTPIEQIERANNQNFTESISKPLEMLASSAASNQDFLRKLTQIQTQSNDKTSKTFKKLPSKYQNMIKVASSVGEVTALDITSEANDFFKSSSILNAEILLNTIMETEKIDCTIPTSMATALLHGSFLWTNSITPSGLACSIILSDDTFKQNILHEGIVLDYSTKFEMSAVSLEKLTKSQILFPPDIEGMIERLRALLALTKFFFSERSYPAQGLTFLVHRCIDNKMLLRTKAYLDSEFIAKLMSSVDDRLHQWLRECCNCQFVQETNLDLMNYASLFQDISLSRFNYNLPPNIKSVQKQSQEGSYANKEKRQKRVDQVKNVNITQGWKLRPDEKWDTIFRSKSRDGPTLSVGCAACLKYHVKGVCYSDCSLSNSHKDLTGEDKAKTNDFIQKLRGE